jgi:hypothetical protein
VQHLLDEIAYRFIADAHRNAFAAPRARREDRARTVDPDLLDLGVVQQRLQRAVARHPREHVADGGGLVVDELETPSEGEVVVTAHLRHGHLMDAIRMAERVGLVLTKSVPHPFGDGLDDGRRRAR